MANVLTRRLIYRNFHKIRGISTIYTINNYTPCVLSKTVSFYDNKNNKRNLLDFKIQYVSIKYYGDKQKCKLDKDDAKPKTIFEKFKAMYRDYWYVLVPVHLVTSAVWFGSFYYLAKSGFDLHALLESWNVSEKITNPLKDSSMGYIAVAYAMYKIFTPLRYAVTLGGTTVSINYLRNWGYIKPVPSTEKLKEMYEMKKSDIITTVKEQKELYKEKKDNLLESVRSTKSIPKSPLKKKTKANDKIEDN